VIPYGKDAGVFAPHVALRPSRLFAWLLLFLAAAAMTGAAVSHLPLPARLALLCVCLLALLRSWFAERHAGLRQLHILDEDEQRFALRFANDRTREARYAGHAVLGALVVFVYFERSGWWRLFGPARYAILRDATDAASFRRLRAWVRLN
jgi:hypothetical protein